MGEIKGSLLTILFTIIIFGVTLGLLGATFTEISGSLGERMEGAMNSSYVALVDNTTQGQD